MDSSTDGWIYYVYKQLGDDVIETFHSELITKHQSQDTLVQGIIYRLVGETYNKIVQILQSNFKFYKINKKLLWFNLSHKRSNFKNKVELL